MNAWFSFPLYANNVEIENQVHEKKKEAGMWYGR